VPDYNLTIVLLCVMYFGLNSQKYQCDNFLHVSLVSLILHMYRFRKEIKAKMFLKSSLGLCLGWCEYRCEYESVHLQSLAHCAKQRCLTDERLLTEIVQRTSLSLALLYFLLLPIESDKRLRHVNANST